MQPHTWCVQSYKVVQSHVLGCRGSSSCPGLPLVLSPRVLRLLSGGVIQVLSWTRASFTPAGFRHSQQLARKPGNQQVRRQVRRSADGARWGTSICLNSYGPAGDLAQSAAPILTRTYNRFPRMLLLMCLLSVRLSSEPFQGVSIMLVKTATLPITAAHQRCCDVALPSRPPQKCTRART